MFVLKFFEYNKEYINSSDCSVINHWLLIAKPFKYYYSQVSCTTTK